MANLEVIDFEKFYKDYAKQPSAPKNRALAITFGMLCLVVAARFTDPEANFEITSASIFYMVIAVIALLVMVKFQKMKATKLYYERLAQLETSTLIRLSINSELSDKTKLMIAKYIKAHRQF